MNTKAQTQKIIQLRNLPVMRAANAQITARRAQTPLAKLLRAMQVTLPRFPNRSDEKPTSCAL